MRLNSIHLISVSYTHLDVYKRQQLNIPSELKIVYVIAFGYPKEEVVLEDIPADGDIKYYRDENQVHHVPKKRIEDIVLSLIHIYSECCTKRTENTANLCSYICCYIYSKWSGCTFANCYKINK